MFARLFSALPPALTSGLYFVALYDPLRVGGQRTRDLIVATLVEILVVLAIAITAAREDGDAHPLRSSAMKFFAMSAFGLLFLGFFAIAFEAPWALLSFFWLTLSAIWPLFMRGGSSDENYYLLMNGVVISVLALVLGIGIAVTALQATHFGFTPDVVARLGLPKTGSGVFLEKPWTAIAAGAFYFGLVALGRLFDVRLVRV